MTAIKICGLSKKFGKRTAVDDLNLTIEKGSVFALLGQNGAGKTTTIRMLSGLTVPSSGDAFLMGKSVVHECADVKKLINISPQETAVATGLSVRENIEFMARLYGAKRNEAKQQTAKMLEKFKLESTADERVKHLSGGMQRRLSIALALISKPSILFLDEPTLGLDVRARRDLWQLIRELKQSMTIVLTTHYLEEALSLSDCIGIMNNSRLVALGTASDIIKKTQSQDFESAFLKLTEEATV